MKATELKKIIKVSIEDSCTVGELKSIKNTSKLFKTDAINDLIRDCTGIMQERLEGRQMYIDDYADVEINAFSAEEYVLCILAYTSSIEGAYLHRQFHRVYGYFSFRVKDGEITLSTEVEPIVDVY